MPPIPARAASPAKAMGLAYVLLGAALAVSEWFWLVYLWFLRIEIDMPLAGDAPFLVRELLFVAVGVLLAVCGARLSSGKPYRRLAAVAAIAYCGVRAWGVMDYAVFSAPTAEQLARNVFLSALACAVYAGGMFLLWLVPVAWGGRGSAPPPPAARPFYWVAGLAVLLAGIGWVGFGANASAGNLMAGEVFTLYMLDAVLLLAGGLFALLWGVGMRGGNNNRAFAVVSFLLFGAAVLFSIVRVGPLLESRDISSLFLALYTILNTAIPAGFMAPVAFVRWPPVFPDFPGAAPPPAR